MDPLTPRKAPLAPSSASLLQLLAIVVCALFGIAMIANTQMEGEASWFWYATLLQKGVRLYADLHLPLQPLFVLETSAWMHLFGRHELALAALSLVHVLLLSFGFLFILRSSDWPGWIKAILVTSAFVIFLQAPAYRFDDYHVIAQICIVYSLFLLLKLQTNLPRPQQLLFAIALGILSGLACTTRLNDGAALAAAAAVITFFLVPRHRLLLVATHLVAAALTLRFVIALTGDSFQVYLANSLFHAAASKGGTSNIFKDPFLLFVNALKVQRIGGKRVLLFLAAITLLALLLQRLTRLRVRHIVLLQLALSAVVFALCPHASQQELLLGLLVFTLSILLILISYLLTPIVFAGTLAAALGRLPRWNSRFILLLLPVAEMASASASTAAQPRQGFFAATALCLLLVPLVWPAAAVAPWLRASFTTVMVLLGVTGITSKGLVPYSWQNYLVDRMFTNRAWYRNPVNGPLYVERDLLNLSTAICTDIDHAGGSRDLLSLPFSYPNYFCGITPWHGYVQTYFDTSTRSTINHLIHELETDPPHWIVYQRQLDVLRGQEWLYHHSQPLAQRDLDELIMQRLATGQWTLIEKRDYLVGDGWFIIRTHP